MKLSMLGVGLLALSSTVGMCQNTAVSVPRHPSTIHQRRANQQQRIAEGIRSGRLNAREASHLERREMRIGRMERHMRIAHNGRLNRADRVVLNRRLNRASRAIYRDKHQAMRQ